VNGSKPKAAGPHVARRPCMRSRRGMYLFPSQPRHERSQVATVCAKAPADIEPIAMNAGIIRSSRMAAHWPSALSTGRPLPGHREECELS
jgi:hypothetical protein